LQKSIDESYRLILSAASFKDLSKVNPSELSLQNDRYSGKNFKLFNSNRMNWRNNRKLYYNHDKRFTSRSRSRSRSPSNLRNSKKSTYESALSNNKGSRSTARSRSPSIIEEIIP
jgi:hypothetical protein